jgi:hypothetical protein
MTLGDAGLETKVETTPSRAQLSRVFDDSMVAAHVEDRYVSGDTTLVVDWRLRAPACSY